MSSTSYHIRQATTFDLHTLMQLAEATWEPTYHSILSKEQIDYMFEVIYSAESLERQMQEGQTFLLLNEGEQPVGFASFSVKDGAGQVYKLNKIYLLPETQGKGYGKVLLEAVEQEVKKRGATILDLNVNRYNKAKGFYERCGYRVWQEDDIAIGPYWMNDYIMRKEL
ncbi:GNAT family N-acetyltransferase [Pontibacter anaerobius]|uniref:GNAT family N-acetyltransferase n=1 Tax=Pontibacter anaerobius TaxID=2993940 RepID=A0ABT3RE05_9BACT|nr:GNAT family N-acetyltransferase [Pontibacter anaerobius]MCX2740072.1 GNAT family N-acetyltransferase [Pontibacter anaerobius]